MNKDVRIALDAMGGDFGPSVVTPAASIALTRRPDVSYSFFGDEKLIRPLFDAHPNLAAKSRIVHTDVAAQKLFPARLSTPPQSPRRGRGPPIPMSRQKCPTSRARPCARAGVLRQCG